MLVLSLLLLSIGADPYEEAYTQARVMAKPLVILFKGPNCVPCERMSDTLKGWDRKKDRIYIELDISHPAAQQLGVTAWPHLMIWDRSLTKRMSVIGHDKDKHTPDVLEQWFQKLLKGEGHGN